jgi:hypothetical protein
VKDKRKYKVVVNRKTDECRVLVKCLARHCPNYIELDERFRIGDQLPLTCSATCKQRYFYYRFQAAAKAKISYRMSRMKSKAFRKRKAERERKKKDGGA